MFRVAIAGIALLITSTCAIANQGFDTCVRAKGCDVRGVSCANQCDAMYRNHSYHPTCRKNCQEQDKKCFEQARLDCKSFAR